MTLDDLELSEFRVICRFGRQRRLYMNEDRPVLSETELYVGLCTFQQCIDQGLNWAGARRSPAPPPMIWAPPPTIGAPPPPKRAPVPN